MNNLLVVPVLSTCLVRNSFLDIVNTSSQTPPLNIDVTHTTEKCAFGIVDNNAVCGIEYSSLSKDVSKSTTPTDMFLYTSDIAVRPQQQQQNTE